MNFNDINLIVCKMNVWNEWNDSFVSHINPDGEIKSVFFLQTLTCFQNNLIKKWTFKFCFLLQSMVVSSFLNMYILHYHIYFSHCKIHIFIKLLKIYFYKVHLAHTKCIQFFFGPIKYYCVMSKKIIIYQYDLTKVMTKKKL